MNIVKRVFKLICICIFCIPIVACGRISRFEWNEVEYNKIAEMIDQLQYVLNNQLVILVNNGQDIMCAHFRGVL